MNSYEDLLDDIKQEGINVIELDLDTNKPCGKCIGNTIFINNRITNKEKFCVLAEELGHYKLTVGDITNLKDISNRKQEIKARRWGYEKFVGIMKIIEAFEKGARSKYELADYLNVSEYFLDDAILYYKQKYGVYFEIDNYLVYFEPTLAIIKQF
ncbi:ImmA/IrrE family metallo-endopeptidase [Clostridium cadaveris]|uniref:ImmA/IrrE family metallo-endopeptidase n=1 Tax=Clostridium cadaveris TaxID=1529 RepID=UPI0025A359DE|nr:ImmA/IrrE family metallo-endopeptidase [Clostridium cadaveris]MDM8313286.1 ImmA/IrrE family metallo-endopeptidase [Clostridium cadaveris]